MHEPKETSLHRHYCCCSFGSTSCTPLGCKANISKLLNTWPLTDHASNRIHLCPQSPSLADIILYSQVYHYLVITLSLLLLQNLFANDNDVQAEVKNCSSWKCPAGFMVPSSKLKLPDPDHATCCEKKLCRGFQCDFASNLLN